MFTQQLILVTILCQVGVGFSFLSSASSFFSSPSSTSSIRNAYSTSTSTSTSLAYAFDTKEKTVTSTEEIIHEMTTGTGTAVLEGVPVVTTTEDDDSWTTTTQQYYDVDAIIDGIDDAYSTLDIVNFDDIDMDNEPTTRSRSSNIMQQEQDRIRESIQESIENDMEDEIAMLHRVNAQPDLIDQETGRVTIIPTLLRRVPLTESTSPLLFFTEEELHTAIVKRTMRKLAQRRTTSSTTAATVTQAQAAPQTHTSIVVSIQTSPTTNLAALQAEFKRVTASHK